jgi:ketosteroid isomerase-like protein
MNPEFVGRFIARLRPAFEADDHQAAGKALEQENVAHITAMYEAILRGDYTVFSNALAEDVEFELVGPPDSPMTGHWQGREAVLAGSARNYARLEDQRPELIAVIAQGDQVNVIGREKGRIRATGREYDVPWMHLFTFREGKVARIYGFSDAHPLILASSPRTE